MADIISRFRAQRLSARIHNQFISKDNRQSKCLMIPRDRSAFVDILKTPGRKYGHYHGLQTCGSIHSCPICATKITEYRQNEIKTLIEKTSDKYHYLITLTFPHYFDQSCFESRKIFIDARRRLKKWEFVDGHHEFIPFREVLRHYKYDGSVSTVEVTFGQNGWHIHSHELFIFEKPIEDLKKFREIVFQNWTKSLLYSGVRIANPTAFFRRSVVIDHLTGDHIQKMTTYLTKISASENWGIATELTKGSLKKQQNGNMTPFGMLYHILDNPSDYKKLAIKFAEYCRVFKGKQAIRFSKGLKIKYGIAEITDEQITENPETILSDLFGFFDASTEWPVVRKNRLRGWVLEQTSICADWLELKTKLNEKIEQIEQKKRGQYDKALSHQIG